MYSSNVCTALLSRRRLIATDIAIVIVVMQAISKRNRRTIRELIGGGEVRTLRKEQVNHCQQ